MALSFFCHQRLENNTGADAKVVIYLAVDPKRVVIDLDRADLDGVVQSEIQTATENSRKPIVTEGIVSNGAKCDRGANDIVYFRTNVAESDHRVSEGLKRSFAGVVLYLNSADHVVK